MAAAIGWVQESFEAGGKLVYMGAGTSGRLGVLDSVECPPTFGVPPEMVVGLIAGGDRAFVKAVEGAEDSEALALEELKALPLNGRDVVIGIAASGRTPYVIGGLQYARSLGCKTVAIACNAGSLVGNAADLAIEPVVGPEVLTGSTRLKAGTAQKMILNMISTGAMVGIGKVYQNLMVDVMQTNEKLRVRARNIVTEATGLFGRTGLPAAGGGGGKRQDRHCDGTVKLYRKGSGTEFETRSWAYPKMPLTDRGMQGPMGSAMQKNKKVRGEFYE